MGRLEKQYIGDGVYAATDPCGGIELTTHNGISETNRIVLEPEVLEGLDAFRRAAALAAKEQG